LLDGRKGLLGASQTAVAEQAIVENATAFRRGEPRQWAQNAMPRWFGTAARS